MVQTPCPINDDVRLVFVEARGSSDRSAGVELAEFKDPVKDGTIFADIESLKLSVIVLHVVGGDLFQEVNIVVRVEARHGCRRNEPRTKDFHFAIEAVIDYKIVGHTNAMRFHGMT